MAILSFDWSLQMYFFKQKNNKLFFASLVKALAKLFWVNWKLRGRQNIIDILNWNDEISRILCKVPSNSYLASSSTKWNGFIKISTWTNERTKEGKKVFYVRYKFGQNQIHLFLFWVKFVQIWSLLVKVKKVKKKWSQKNII